jgi:alkylation response protein AidB-like acyl-CoA dehydrogenase
MEFDWTDDRKELRRGAVEFASRRLTDGVAERDRGEVFSRELWDACAEFGLQGLLVPSRWGGRGQDLLSAVAVMEGVGYGALDNGLVFSVAAHAASCEGALASCGTEAQKDEWLPRLADGSAIGATAITEPDSGSNALALATTAPRRGRLPDRRLEDLRDQCADRGSLHRLRADR